MRHQYKSMLCVTTSLSLGVLSLGALSLCATPAMAQVTAPAAKTSAPNDLGTVVVTARRIDERLQDVPISITVFNQQALSNENVVNSEDLARITPSLSVNDNFGSDNSSFAIRGFIQENGTAPSVGTYFGDVVAPRGPASGVPAGDGAGAGSFFDLQNVQVLKGPQGTLQGINTTGGSVLLVPQKPTGNFDGYVEASYGNFDMRRIQAVVNVPINDNVRFRVGIDDQKRDGYLNNVSPIGPKHLANVDYTALRASLVVDITPNLENYTIASYSLSHNYGDVQKIWPGGTGFFASLTFPAAATTPGYYDVMNNLANPESRLETWQIINTTTWHPNDNVTVKNIASYAELKDDVNSSLFGLYLPFNLSNYGFPAGYPNTPLPFSDVNHPPGEDTAHESTITEEFRVNGTALADRLTWQTGVYTEFALPIGTVGNQSTSLSSCINTQTFECTDPLGALFGFPVGDVNYTVSQTSYTDYGLYGQATYTLTDHLKLTGGYRYTWDRESVKATQKTYLVDTPPNYGILSEPGLTNPFCTQPVTIPSGCVNHLYMDSNRPTWLIDLDYTPIKDLLVYAKYSRGYREGTIAPNITAPLDIVKPESVDNYEIGFKSSFRAPVKGTFDVAFFYNDFTDQQIQTGFNAIIGSGLSSTAAPINAGASTIYGLEISSSINPARGLVLSVGYTYLNTRIDKVSNFNNVVVPGFIPAAFFKVGDPIVLTPPNKVVLDANYQLPFIRSEFGKVSIGGTFSFTDRMLGNYIDGQAATPAALQKFAYIPATNLLDLHASWNGIYGLPVDLTVFGTNVTGLKYYTFPAGLGTAGLGFESTELGPPAMFGVRLKYHFGK